jgi:fumarylacetoacetate (FAA) hydrolase
MKLATIKDGTRDGQLAVVARDLKTAHLADGIAPTLRAALDDWAFIAPQLDALYLSLNAGRAQRPFEFQPQNCMAPLPRAFLRVGACAYLQPLELAYQARALDLTEALPEALRAGPLMYLAGADDLLGAFDDIALAHEAWGVDFDAGLAAILDDVPMGATPDQAHLRIKLLMLVNEVSLRNLMPDEQAAGYGPLQSKPSASCSPVAVTPDELGEAWQGGKVHLPLRTTQNGKLVGQPQAGLDMAFNFPQLIAHLTRTRAAPAGTIVGSGAVSNKDVRRGYSSIFEKRCLEIIAGGAPETPFLQFGDTIRIDMPGADGKSVFGAIEQTFRQAEPRKTR